MTELDGSATGNGNAVTATAVDGYGVYATATQNGTGVYGKGGEGVRGESATGNGVVGQSTYRGTERFGYEGNGVAGFVASVQTAAVYARNDADWDGTAPSCFGLAAYSHGTAVYGQGRPAGYFDGDVQVTGDLILVNTPQQRTGGDIAEDFDLADDSADADPGTVLVISARGKLSVTAEPYDTRVAGVVSGAGPLRPAVVLQRNQSARPRSPIALIGTVYCKVDASSGSILAGDLLTTSATPGHAMKVADRSRALGAILGKALDSFAGDCGMIPILVSLR